MNSIKNAIALATILIVSLPAISFAKCAGGNPSSSSFKTSMQSGDKIVSKKWMASNLVGRKVDFGNAGSEHYLPDGSYFYKTRDAEYRPNGYKFYSNGMRCLDYASGPRYDLYVVNSGKLYLINGQGSRNAAKLRKLK